MEEPLISVIVPVYNVENYLRESINSIINQSYQNLEIIIVDDGSTDKSGKICDEFFLMDERIQVIHQENQGLSAARNTGMAYATAEFYFFIDSDDLIFPDVIRNLYEIMSNSDADITISGTYTSFSQTCDFPSLHEENIRVQEYNSIEAIQEILYSNNYATSVWGRLYRKHCFKNIHFPVGRYYEDLFTTYRVFLNAEKIAYTTKIGYLYFKRRGSISMENGLSDKQFDCFLALHHIQYEVINRYPQLTKSFENCYVSFYLRLLQNAKKSELGKLSQIFTNVKKFRINVLTDPKALGRVKAAALLSFFGIDVSKKLVDAWYSRKTKY